MLQDTSRTGERDEAKLMPPLVTSAGSMGQSRDLHPNLPALWGALAHPVTDIVPTTTTPHQDNTVQLKGRIEGAIRSPVSSIEMPAKK